MEFDPLVFSITQIRLRSWPLTFEDLWPLAWWAAQDLLELQEGLELLDLLVILVPADHQGIEAYQENLETLVPEVWTFKSTFDLLIGAQTPFYQCLFGSTMNCFCLGFYNR